MKGIRFFLEYPSLKDKKKATVKEPGNHEGNVLALILDTGRVEQKADKTLNIVHDAIGALLFKSNSPVCSTGVCNEYLKERCKRIPESLAREIHTELFDYLDD